jgi:hypothetical protein
MKMQNQKVAQNVIISLGFFVFSKNHNGLPERAQDVTISLDFFYLFKTSQLLNLPKMSTCHNELTKRAQDVTIFWVSLSFQKNQNELPKLAQLAKNTQSGHPDLNFLALVKVRHLW